MSDSSSDSFDSYNEDGARCFLQEWKAAKDRYSEATRENGQLERRLEASQPTLLTAEEEANAAQARLAKSDAMVAGKMIFKKNSVFTPSASVLTTRSFL